MIELYNEDCYEWIKTIPDNSIDLVITDPPYLIETKGGGICGDSGNVKQFKENHLDSMKDGFNNKVLDELCRVMKKINIYIWCSQKQLHILYEYFVNQKKCNWNLICWHKTNPVPSCGNKYLSDTEYILFFREKGVKVFGNYATKRTFYVSQTNKQDKKKYNHPTIKPLNIIENLIVNSTKEGGGNIRPIHGKWNYWSCM